VFSDSGPSTTPRARLASLCKHPTVYRSVGAYAPLCISSCNIRSCISMHGPSQSLLTFSFVTLYCTSTARIGLNRFPIAYGAGRRLRLRRLGVDDDLIPLISSPHHYRIYVSVLLCLYDSICLAHTTTPPYPRPATTPSRCGARLHLRCE